MQLHEMIEALIDKYDGGSLALAEHIGIARSTLNRYRRPPDSTGRLPDAATLARIRKACDLQGDAKRDLWVAWVVAHGAPASELAA